MHSIQKIILKLLFCCAASAASLAFAATPINKIVAVVNDQVITTSDLVPVIQALQAQGQTKDLEKTALKQLIDQDLQLQAAKNMKITVSDDEVEAAFKEVASEHQIPLDQLPAALQQQGTTVEKFKAQLKKQLTIQKFQQQALANTITLNPQAVDKMMKKLEQDQATAKPQVLYHFIDMLIPLPANPSEADLNTAKQTFDKIAAALNQGQSFDSVSHNILGAAPQDLGWKSADQLPPDFVKLADTLKIGEATPPVRTPNGVNILKLVEKKTAQQNTPLNSNIVETHVRHILLKKNALTPDSTLERRLVALRNDLMHGANFATVAEANSQDPGSVANGGDLGWMKPGMLDPKFEAAMDKLKVGEISQPVQTQFGWHLIQVEARRTTQDKQTALKQMAQQMVFQQKMQDAIKGLISQLRAQAYVKEYN